MLKPIIKTRPNLSIFTDPFLYLITKSDASEGRIEEIKLLEASAIEQFEKEAGIFIGEHTFEILLDNYKSGIFEFGPIQDEDFKIEVLLNNDLDYSDLDPEFYDLVIDDVCKLRFKGDLPKIQKDSKIKISGKLGYTTGTVPKMVKHAILMHITYWFDNPENTNKRFNTAFDTVIDTFRKGFV